MKKCNEDWKTCGHCKAAFGESKMYPSCDKVGPLGTVFGNDVCPNAPDGGDGKETSQMEVAKIGVSVDYAYAQFMISMNDEPTKALLDACDDNSSKFVEIVRDLLGGFLDEWNKVDALDHEIIGDDFINELDKLADWIKKHAEDIARNGLEYGGYVARKPEYVVIASLLDECSGVVADPAVISEDVTRTGQDDRDLAVKTTVSKAFIDAAETAAALSPSKWMASLHWSGAPDMAVDLSVTDEAGRCKLRKRYALVLDAAPVGEKK